MPGTRTSDSRRREQTRGRLLAAAFEVFAAKGFGQARIEEVCEAAGFSRGAFYSNFATLQELFFALYEQRTRAAAQQVEQALSGAQDVSSIGDLVERVVEALDVDRDWLVVRTDFLLHAARNPDIAVALVAHREAQRAALAEPLGRVVQLTALPASLRTADGLARAVIAVHDGAAQELLLNPDRLASRRWLSDLLTALLDRGE